MVVITIAVAWEDRAKAVAELFSKPPRVFVTRETWLDLSGYHCVKVECAGETITSLTRGPTVLLTATYTDALPHGAVVTGKLQ